ncbi:hypothetical protein OB931_20980, partial [Aeromonas media]|uniref:hypothetical protein n=1 Tax=Aeromonas media TaxID=651 RepID=UPI00259F129D
ICQSANEHNSSNKQLKQQNNKKGREGVQCPLKCIDMSYNTMGPTEIKALLPIDSYVLVSSMPYICCFIKATLALSPWMPIALLTSDTWTLKEKSFFKQTTFTVFCIKN